RGLRSSIRGNFSYRDHHQPAPRATVWVIRSDDQPRARQLLREAGLLEASPANPSSFLPSVGHDARLRTQSPTRRARMRLGLLVLAAVALALWLNQFRNPGWDLAETGRTTAAAPAFDPALQPIAVDAEAIHRITTPRALAPT